MIFLMGNGPKKPGYKYSGLRFERKVFGGEPYLLADGLFGCWSPLLVGINIEMDLFVMVARNE